jgi:16S rRNA (adenine1518-N6/adenine1519-N6)-dimethyltransferase
LIKAKKSLGQYFLDDERIIDRIVESVAAKITDITFEIGPGTGALTHALVAGSGLLVAVELDVRMIEKLRREIRSDKFTLVEADALTIDWHALLDSSLKAWRATHPRSEVEPRLRVVANLPYYISTPIIERLLKTGNRLFDLTLMLQEEVVDRIVSAPGGKEYGYFSVLVQYYCNAVKLFTVPPESFSPVPKVNSAIVKLKTHNKPIIQIADEAKFFALVRACFAQRRKTILNNLKAAVSIAHFDELPELALQKCGIDAQRRAETFSLKDFEALYNSLFYE